MTKDEIKKALECCSSDVESCAKCPYDFACTRYLCKDALNLIAEQEKEIERLKAEVNKGCDNCETIKQAQIDVLKKLRSMVSDKEALIQSYIADGCLTIEDMYTDIDILIEEVENDK